VYLERSSNAVEQQLQKRVFLNQRTSTYVRYLKNQSYGNEKFRSISEVALALDEPRSDKV
jgi:hypothetical protein